MKIGILTFFSSINYGAFLQAYSLQSFIQERYLSETKVEIIDYTSEYSYDAYLRRIVQPNKTKMKKMIEQYDIFLECQKELALSRDKLISDDLNEFQNYIDDKYDVIIVGSDEVWKTDGFRCFPNAYWMNYEMPNTKLLAFAVSGRSNYQKLSENDKRFITTALERFDYIGIRDIITLNELKKISNLNYYLNSDPTLLYAETLREMVKSKSIIRRKYGISNSRKTVTLMLKNEEVVHGIQGLLGEFEIINLFCYHDCFSDEKNMIEISPFEWNDIISVSDYIITDFYHATLFSIIHMIPFFAIEADPSPYGKIEAFLASNDLKDYYININQHKENYERVCEIIYKRVLETIDNHNTSHFLKIIEKEKEKNQSFFTKLDKIICR